MPKSLLPRNLEVVFGGRKGKWREKNKEEGDYENERINRVWRKD